MLSPSDFNNAVPQFTNGDYASNPINPQYIAEPDAVDYNRGAEPLQTLPAQWWNWFLNKFTGRFNKVNIYVNNIFNELAQLLTLVSVTPSGTEGSPTVGQLKDMFENKYPNYLALLMYPVGSIYWTGKAPNDGGDPNVLFGGTWVQIKDRFILAAGDTYTNGVTGGAATVTLTIDQMPAHNHTMQTAGSHSHVTTLMKNSSGKVISATGANSTGHTHELSGTFTTGNCIAKDSATAITSTGGMNANSSGYAGIGDRSGRGAALTSGPFSYQTRSVSGLRPFAPSDSNDNTSLYMDISHTHNMEHRHQVTLSGNTSRESGSHTHNMDHKHDTNDAGDHTHTINSRGGGLAHNNMPPYIVKYCWERTA